MLMKVSLGACTNSQTAKNPGAQLTFSFSFLTSSYNDIIWEERSNLFPPQSKTSPCDLHESSLVPFLAQASIGFTGKPLNTIPEFGRLKVPTISSKTCRRPKLLSNSVKPFKPCQLGFSCTLAGTRSPTTCPTTSVEPFRPSIAWSNRVRNTNMLTSNSLN